LLTAGTEDAVLLSEEKNAIPQTSQQVINSLRLRARLRALKVLIDARSAGFRLDAGPDNPEIGETILEGQPFGLKVRSSAAATVTVLHVNGDGSSEVILPPSIGMRGCIGGNHIRPDEPTVMCQFQGAASPFGLDLLYVIAWEGDVPAVASLPTGSGARITDATLDTLNRLVNEHHGHVAIQESRVFTLKR
jgi:hypothetical protein